LYAGDQKHITVVILSYNNASYCEHNLSSVLGQRYENYQVLYIDDCSTDQTNERVVHYLAQHDAARRVTYVRNGERRGALVNHWYAVHQCVDEDIIVHLDGDDFFAHDRVLERINQEYQDPAVWLTYGSYCEYPSGKIGMARAIPEEIVRSNQWALYGWPHLYTTHLRTFYAWLFKQIKVEDLTMNGSFFPVACDVAFMTRMTEMAGAHARFIPDILYCYNVENPLCDFNTKFQEQMRCAQIIRSKKPYAPISKKMSPLAQSEMIADMVIFSYDRPMQLYALLESIEQYVSRGVGSIAVIYRTSNEQYEKGYQKVKDRFAQVIFHVQSSTNPHADFKRLTMQAVRAGTHSYILFAVDDMMVKDAVDFSDAIEWLEKTHAYGFYLRLGNHIDQCYTLNKAQEVPPLVDCGQNVCAWEFKPTIINDWNYPNTVDMTIYRKKEVIKVLDALPFVAPNSLESQWYGSALLLGMGLCYQQSKVINIPLNRVQDEINNRSMNVEPEYLLDLFMNGYRIDRAPLHAICNRSAHLPVELTFKKIETES
jgi:hypothetical protein